jgi:hypothetical protein
MRVTDRLPDDARVATAIGGPRRLRRATALEP